VPSTSPADIAVVLASSLTCIIVTFNEREFLNSINAFLRCSLSLLGGERRIRFAYMSHIFRVTFLGKSLRKYLLKSTILGLCASSVESYQGGIDHNRFVRLVATSTTPIKPIRQLFRFHMGYEHYYFQAKLSR
jgi:hypothetical protein